MRSIWLALFLFLVIGCAATKDSGRVIDEGEGRLVKLEEISPSPLYSHPADLDLEVVRAALGSVVVSHPTSLLKRLLTQKTEVRSAAFSPKDIDILAAPLKAALGRATPAERVAFFLTSHNTPMAIDVTSGVAFLKDKEFHFILANDHTEVSTEGRSWVPFDDPLRPHEVGSFEVIPQPHQKRITPSALKGRREEIVLDAESLTAGPPPAASVEAPKEPAAPSPENATLEARLRLLKKLKDESLITEEEYTEKKKELLKTLGE